MSCSNKLLICAFLSIALLLSSTPSHAAAPVELSFSTLIGPNHQRNQAVLQPWVELIKKETGGKVDFTMYYSGALTTFPEAYDAAVTGIADISEGITRDVRGRFPLTEAVGLPGLPFSSSKEASKVLWHLYKNMPEVQKEFAGAKVLWLYTSPPAKLLLAKKPVRNLNELRGMKIRPTGSFPAELGRALGVSPVAVTSGDLYMAMEKGVVDGAMIPTEVMISRRLSEVTKYVVDIDLGTTLFFVVMNIDVWNSLPPDVQQVIEKYSGEWAVDFSSKQWDLFDKQTEDAMKAQGIEFIELDPAEKLRWQEALKPLQKNAIEYYKKQGLPGEKAFSLINSLQ